ncbi:DUF5686 and carboxypeptidase-like regulatory domain-containing protein [Pontibacter arcticus]|uniref:CarboxypepD_reg-like domain-containing protein n=1 Tax=Pontibacter arcticus TaxID=2080288 RepID=A0A364RJD6_9BACT|nr:DUF5686 and carboxypeptidase-like regulatory domain-containing protein [Pontibacter arcticus]RAU84417.1 hypothetical protein DP923_05120 [Pontibacter arcticus]
MLSFVRPLLLLCFFLICTATQAQTRTVYGTVRDANSSEKLPFVSISVNDGETGTTTDLDGKYKLQLNRPVTSLRFSYVGYDAKIIYPDSAERYDILLPPSVAQLQEVVILGSGKNPAHRIIRLATQNRTQHRLSNLPAYTFRTYNKFILTATDAQEFDLSDTLQLSEQDSAYLDMRNLLAGQHLFMMESITDYAFLKPDNASETILATRVSGIQQPSFGAVAAEARDFSVYEDMPVFFGKRYLSPLSPGSTRKYDFILQETVVTAQDTTFIISFKPEAGKNFDALKGLLYITSNGWAVQNIIAESADGAQRGVRLQQQFKQTGPQQKWFPTELDLEITVPKITLRGHQPYGRIRTYITNINLNPALKKSDFGVVALQQKANAAKQPDTFWQQYRPDSLNQLELRTYQQLDSVGRAQKLDRNIRVLEYLFRQQIPIGPISLDLNRLLRVGAFEGLRLGIGAHTNEVLSERFKVGGYWAYGFRDEETKYGADASFILHKPSQLQVKAEYFEDVLEPGGKRFPFQQTGFLKDLRRVVLPLLSYASHKSIAVSGRMFRYLQAHAQLRQEEHRPTLGIITDETPINFNLAEAALSLRYAPGETYMNQFNQLMPMQTELPFILLGQYTRGFNSMLEGEHSYHKYEAQATTSWRHRTFGQTSVTLSGGFISGDAPYISLFNGYGSYSSDHYVYTGKGFETMRPYEFFSDKFASLFFQQNFGKLLFRSKFFQPDIVALTNIGFGDLDGAVILPDVPVQVMNKGYYESGLLFNNIIRSPFSGVGVGAFYRYGPYAAASSKDNLVFKFTFSLAF